MRRETNRLLQQEVLKLKIVQKARGRLWGKLPRPRRSSATKSVGQGRGAPRHGVKQNDVQEILGMVDCKRMNM